MRLPAAAQSLKMKAISLGLRSFQTQSEKWHEKSCLRKRLSKHEQYIYIYIRTVSSLHLLSALMNWFKLVYGLFEQSDMRCTLNFCQDQPERNKISAAKVKGQLNSE